MPRRPFSNIDYSAEMPKGTSFRKEEIWTKISLQRKQSRYSLWIKIAMTLILILSTGGLYNNTLQEFDTTVPSFIVESDNPNEDQGNGYDNEMPLLMADTIGEYQKKNIKSNNHLPERSIVIVSVPKLVRDSASSELMGPTRSLSQVESQLAQNSLSAETTKTVILKKELSASAKVLKDVFANVNANNLKENYAIEKSTLKRFRMGSENTPPMARVFTNEEKAFNYIIYEKNNKD